MNILLTGVEWDYKGTIAPHLKDYLTEYGFQITSFIGDIRDKESWYKYDNTSYDFIIHLAGRSDVRPSWNNPMEWEDINVNGTKRCFEYARRNNTKVLYASTSNAKEWWLNPYATTKRIMEHLAEAYDVNSIGLRFHNIWPGRPDMIYRILESGKSLPYINQEMYRDFTHIDDLCSAILTIIENYDILKPEYDVLDIGSGNPKSVYEVCKKYWKSDIPFDSVPLILNENTHGERYYTEADVEYLYDLGWTPKYDILEDIKNG